MKKYFILLIACALALCLFVACDDSEAETEPKPDGGKVEDEIGDDGDDTDDDTGHNILGELIAIVITQCAEQFWAKIDRKMRFHIYLFN